MIESRYLQDNMQNIQRLMNIQTLKHFEIKSLAKLLRLSKIREYEDGEIIIREGENDQWLYFLLEGKVRVSKDNCEITTISKKGEIFGEMRIIDTLSRSASIHAVGKTICLAVDTLAQSKIAGAGERDERIDFLLLLYRIFAEYMSIRLRLTNEELVKARKQVERLKKSAQ